ncbi:hypothetical protein AB0876_28820 [Mycobacterium sp. NPDC049093]
MSTRGETTEVRECICGRQFTVVVEHAKPWTVCPHCLLGDSYTPSGLDEFHPDTTHNPNPEVADG